MNKDSWSYRSGDAFLPKPIVHFLDQYIVGSKQSLYYINYWHGMHFLSGVVFSFFLFFFYQVQHPIITYIVLHTLWELWQLSIGMTVPNLRGVIDILNDTLLGTMGLYGSLLVLKSKQ